MEPLYKGHIGTLETVLYIEVGQDNYKCPLYGICPYFRVSSIRDSSVGGLMACRFLLQ